MRKIHESAQMEVFALDFEDYESVEVPLYINAVQAGFPSPADDYVELSLDLLKYLVDKPHTTFCVRVKGNSIEGNRLTGSDKSRTLILVAFGGKNLNGCLP